jgi:iron complex outermembrane receptor protein
VEVLKDGASSIYGTDAIGGVINFILRDDYQGLMARAGFDDTTEGGGDIIRYSVVGGYGNLNKDKFNIMASLSLSDSRLLLGTQRSWVNTQQPSRGLSADTRGTPFATLNGISSLFNVLSRGNTSTTTRGSFIDPATGLSVSTVNTLVLQGPGALAGTGMYPYDWQLWSNAGAQYGATMDTGIYAALQQPVKNTNFVGVGKYKAGQHTLTAEVVIGRSDSTKWFSPSQITSSTAANTSATPSGVSVANPFFNLAYPSTGADYNAVFNVLAAYFPQLAVNRGNPMPFRWRFYPGGDRRYTTISDTQRFLVSAEGPLPWQDWEYRSGISTGQSKSRTQLGEGYYYTQGVANLISTGVLSPFNLTQTDAAKTALAALSAKGVQLFGGKYATTTADFTASGPLHQLPAGQLQAAIGADYRKETYSLAGQTDPTLNTTAGLIFNAPFDNVNATNGTLKRTVTAAFAELDIPVVKGLNFDPSVRYDHYSDFGNTVNPKYTLRYNPLTWLLFRGSYSTGFRVPTFAQQYFGITVNTSNSNITDPATGAAVPQHEIWTGHRRTVNPETAKMSSLGTVVEISKHLSVSVDWWTIDRHNLIEALGETLILKNYTLVPDRLVRDASGGLIAIDNTWLNGGEAVTTGIEFGVHGNMNVAGGLLTADFDLSDLLTKKSRLLEGVPFGPSEVGKFTRLSDLGIKYKATTSVNYRKGDWSFGLTQIYRSGYLDNYEGTLANGTYPAPLPANWNPKVKSYFLYNLNVSYKGLMKNLTVNAGIKNILNTNPPFSAYYDTSSGGGSDWDPRVGDPRGRAITLSAEYKFF